MHTDDKAVKLRIVGIVQGVGFRPFVYRLAKRLDLRGYVVNLGGSEVEIHIEGNADRIREFFEKLRVEKPPNARISVVQVEEVKPKGYSDFEILKSISNQTLRSIIPPDIAICSDCVREILDAGTRFYRYPWNSCAWCGPRFSMMYATPYDRANTAMAVFELCNECLRSYRDPNDTRRFHGQGISCPKCGPKTSVLDKNGMRVEVEDPVRFIAERILEGSIVAIKGIGGYHIACLASRNDVIIELRKRKRRPCQPLALMARDFDIVESIAVPPPGAKELLESKQRPIVIMPKREGAKVSELVAPGLSTIGVMLPYTGFQALLLNEIPDGFLVMTSGNIHGEPMCTDLGCVLERLSNVVDYIVEHERAIVHRVDDSVIRFTDGEPVFLRRGRGYAPEWIEVPTRVPDLVALGAEMQTAGAVAFEDKVVLTQFIGDMDNLSSLKDLRREVLWLVEVYKLKPKAIAIDMHPRYHNRIVAKELSERFGVKVVEVQHHHAHAVSVLGEYGIDDCGRVVAITVDGTGYGIDGGTWGGEVLLATYRDFKRVGSLRPFNLPGGDSAAVYTVKPLIALMASAGFSEEEVLHILEKLGLIGALAHGHEEASMVYTLAKKGMGTVTTSVGRVLDAFSALLNVCTRRTYEGEPPMRLESLADKGSEITEYEVRLTSLGDRIAVEVQDMLIWAIESVGTHRREDIALTILKSLGRGLALIAVKQLRGLRNAEQFIVMSGGAAVNTYIVQGAREVLGGEGLRLLLPKSVPPGDGGIALGQALVSSKVIEDDQ